MITTKRTAVSDKDFETKQSTRIEANFDDFQEAPALLDIETFKVQQPEITDRIMPAAEKEDVMPTIKVRRQVESKHDVPEVKQEEKEEVTVVKADAKTKAIMMTYMAVAFVLAMVVLATGLIVTNRAAEVNSLQRDVNFAYNRILGQQDEIGYLADEIVVSQKADRLGMSEAGNIEVIEVIPLNDEVTYEPKTNGFDKFCDFLSNIIGG